MCVSETADPPEYAELYCADRLRARSLSPASLYGWLLDLPVVWAFTDADAAQATLDAGGFVDFHLAASNVAMTRDDVSTIEGHRCTVPQTLVSHDMFFSEAAASTAAPRSDRARPRHDAPVHQLPPE